MSVLERAEPGPTIVEPVDVLIITAADAEDEAVRLVGETQRGQDSLMQACLNKE